MFQQPGQPAAPPERVFAALMPVRPAHKPPAAVRRRPVMFLMQRMNFVKKSHSISY
jgi:hypothetical protein